METSWKYVIATDMPVDENWGFARVLGEELGVRFRVESANSGIHDSRWRRMIVYLTMAKRLFAHRSQMLELVTWQQFFGLFYAWLCILFKVKEYPRLTIMTFIYRRRRGLLGRVHRMWLRDILRSRYVDRVLVSSPAEVSHYAGLLGVSPEIFSYVELGVDVEYNIPTCDEGYWFSTGRSNRDYDFLIDALSGSGQRLIVACDKLAQPKAVNIEVRHNAFGKDMLKLMANARGVIIILDDEVISSGQLVALQAMMLGKPVIVSWSYSILPYVEDGLTAFVIVKKKPELLKAISMLNAYGSLRRQFSLAAKSRFELNYTTAAFAKRVSQVLKSDNPIAFA